MDSFTGAAPSGTSTSTQDTTTRNFIEEQFPLLERAFQEATGFLDRGVPASATSLLNTANRPLLADLFGLEPHDDIKSQIRVLTEDISRQPFNRPIDEFEAFIDRVKSTPNPATALFQDFLLRPDNEALAFLRPIARGEDIRTNPEVDAAIEAINNDLNVAFDRSIPSVTGPLQSRGRTRGNAVGRSLTEAQDNLSRTVARTNTGIRLEDIYRQLGRRDSAISQIGQFSNSADFADLQAIGGVGSTANQDNNLILQALQGILQGTSLEENRRNQVLGLRGSAIGQEAGLTELALRSAPTFAREQTELPFSPFDLFFDVASAPLGGTQSTVSTQPIFANQAATVGGLALGGASLFGQGGPFGSGAAGGLTSAASAPLSFANAITPATTIANTALNPLSAATSAAGLVTGGGLFK